MELSPDTVFVCLSSSPTVHSHFQTRTPKTPCRPQSVTTAPKLKLPTAKANMRLLCILLYGSGCATCRSFFFTVGDGISRIIADLKGNIHLLGSAGMVSHVTECNIVEYFGDKDVVVAIA